MKSKIYTNSTGTKHLSWETFDDTDNIKIGLIGDKNGRNIMETGYVKEKIVKQFIKDLDKKLNGK